MSKIAKGWGKVELGCRLIGFPILRTASNDSSYSFEIIPLTKTAKPPILTKTVSIQ